MSTRLSCPRAARGLRLFAALWLILAFLIPAAAPVAAQTLDPLAQAKAELWREGPPRDLPRVAPVAGGFAVPGMPALAPASPDAVPPMANWSGIVFHSYRSGAGDIYAARVDATAARPVIADPAGTDITPRVSPDLSRIAFVSDRDGNREIYTAALDGSNVRRLTNTPGWDAEPAWSPGGTQLAYAYDDMRGVGIFVMNADGSNPRQITTGADYYPTWSPDGAIAFLRYADGTASLWRVNADGTDLTKLVASLPYAAHSVWSPDGSRIAFEYDPDGDGWNELAVYDVATGGRQTVYDVNREGFEPWMGSWSPDGSTLMFTLVAYQVIDGELFLGGGLLATVPATGGQAVALPGSTGEDFAPDWYKTDVIKPVTAVDALPAYSPAAGFTVSWRGVDQGGAGLASFDVQVRVNGGEWQAWKTGAHAGSDNYTGQPGALVEFRARGRDNAYNVESWPASPDTTTRTYTAVAAGRITDVRGSALPGVTVGGSPGSGNGALSDVWGAYRAHFNADNLISLITQHPAYSPTLAFLGGRTEFRAPLVLADKTSYLAAGNPEGGPATVPAPWILGGDVKPALTAAVRKVGAASITLGSRADLTAPVTVGSGNVAAIAAGGDVVNVVTVRVRPSASDGADLLLTRKVGDGPWSAPVVIYGDKGLPGSIAAVMDSTAGLHLVWLAAPYLYTTGPILHCYVPAGSFTCPAEPIPDYGESTPPVIAIDPLDGLHVAGSHYAHRTKAGVWDVVELFPTQGWPAAPGIAGGSDGRPHLVWSVDASFTMYSTRNPDGAWTAPLKIGAGGQQWSMPQIAVGGDGTLHVTWLDHNSAPRGGTYYTYKTPDGEWQPSRWVSPSLERVAFSATRSQPQLLMQEGSALREYTLYAEGEWQVRLGYPQEEWPLDGKTHPRGVYDNRGALHVLVSDDIAAWPRNIYYRGPKSASTDLHSILSQEVTIPADSHRPTLSFWIKTDPTAELSSFSITAEANGAGTPLAPTLIGRGWRHGWIDMSRFAGQKVMLRFELHTPGGTPAGRVYLDDITLGPWLTPVLKSARIDGATVTIEGDNFLATPAVRVDDQALTVQQNGGMLTATAAAPIKPGRHTVWVTNPGGQPAAAEVWVGQGLWLPRVIVGF